LIFEVLRARGLVRVLIFGVVSGDLILEVSFSLELENSSSIFSDCFLLRCCLVKIGVEFGVDSVDEFLSF